ncbi:Restriction of telomere capping protein 5 [Cyphellophora attinorum]|uniref:Restriction of telomere capping protein 5 n=1 Tax=Cyphellophora attinorum TaxID=1664694 RepID=A0A0N0NS07_9EURO|nr:Restriction of telomere capping protein 5 [Phialophora attinorum]KPI45449.1 Restriction of telomere capping protein 5 [Phialophora attinorum]
MLRKIFDALGQGQPAEPLRQVPIEQLSHELALRFATRCYSHLEIAHYKDNFKSLAEHQGDVEYWKEDTLARFLALPEPLRASPVIFQMCSYLGAFPFPMLAPCILTREAMIKVITIMTGRYKRILKRGNRDKAKLLFRSLAVFDRRASVASPSEKPNMQAIIDEQKPDEMLEEEAAAGKRAQAGFAIDEPANDGEEEDDDDLALAALDSLDAIEVFKQDQIKTIDRKMNHAIIPTDNFRRLLMLLLLFGGIRAQSNLSEYGDGLDGTKVEALEDAANAIIEAFDPDPLLKGIRYSNFVKVLSTTMPDLFEPLNHLFEHFLFSRNIDLSKHRGAVSAAADLLSHRRRSPIQPPDDKSSSQILTDTRLSQLSMSMHLAQNTSSSPTNIYSSHARFHQIFSTSSQGTSLSSFSRYVMSWTAPTLIVISGTSTSSSFPQSTPLIFTAYLPHPWIDSTHKHDAPTILTSESSGESPPLATLTLLSPRHSIFPSTLRPQQPYSYFNARTGIALGCIIPPQPRTGAPNPPIPGAASVIIDTDLSEGTFVHDLENGSGGGFVCDPGLVEAQGASSSSAASGGETKAPWPRRIDFEVEGIEVWGVTFDSGNEDDEDGVKESEVEKQRKRLEWEEKEAERRRAINFGGDKDGARHLLEMAGLVGNGSGQGRSGGSMG